MDSNPRELYTDRRPALRESASLIQSSGSSGTSTESPLSAAQLGLWFAQQLDPQNAAFNVGEYLEILGPIDPAQFEATLRQVMLETELLRIRLVERAGEPLQIIVAPAQWSLPFFDVSGEADPTAAALSSMRADLQRPTDLLRGPLFAFALFKAEADRFLWYARYHHIVIDGLSRSLIARRVADVYTALAGGSLPDASAVGPLTAIVADDVAYRASDDFARDRQHWIEYLEGAPDPTSIADGHFVQSRGVLRRTVHLHAPGTARLRAIGRLSRVVTAATALLMHRLTRAEDLVLGLAVAARSDATRSAAGMAANVVPLRLKVDPGASVRAISLPKCFRINVTDSPICGAIWAALAMIGPSTIRSSIFSRSTTNSGLQVPLSLSPTCPPVRSKTFPS